MWEVSVIGRFHFEQRECGVDEPVGVGLPPVTVSLDGGETLDFVEQRVRPRIIR